MNREQAKAILLLFRPGTGDAADPEIAAALAYLREDPELERWFEQHCAFQVALRAKFRELPAPAALKEAILAERKIIRPRRWFSPPARWLALAAAVVLFAGLTALWINQTAPDVARFRARMVQTALRQYSMDIRTNDLEQVRQFLATNGAPAQYQLTRGLQQLEVTGGGLLRWQGKPVSMVCFDQGKGQMLFLFMAEQKIFEAPPAQPQFAQVNKLMTVTWTRDGITYLLTGAADRTALAKYL